MECWRTPGGGTAVRQPEWSVCAVDQIDSWRHPAELTAGSIMKGGPVEGLFKTNWEQMSPFQPYTGMEDHMLPVRGEMRIEQLAKNRPQGVMLRTRKTFRSHWDWRISHRRQSSWLYFWVELVQTAGWGNSGGVTGRRYPYQLRPAWLRLAYANRASPPPPTHPHLTRLVWSTNAASWDSLLETHVFQAPPPRPHSLPFLGKFPKALRLQFLQPPHNHICSLISSVSKDHGH